MSGVDGLSSMYNEYLNNKTTTSSNLEGKLTSDYKNATDDELMTVCKEFEAYFTEQMFKSMQKMVPKSEEGSSNKTMEYFEDMIVKEYAKNSTEQTSGNGIAQMLYEQMKRNYSV